MIKLASPDILESDIQRCNDVIRSGNLVQGEWVARFEQALTSFAGFGSWRAVSSGTAALHIALKALGVGPGDSVIVPAFTFPATANVVENLGANTILCDVDPASYVVTPQTLQQTIDAHADHPLKAIIVVHEFGYPADMEAMAQIAKTHNLKIIEDAACALGTVSGDKHVGWFSDAACFSLHPRKAITCGEGGAIVSRNPALIERINALRNHGMARVGTDIDFVEAGLNYRLTDFQAALVTGQVERFDAEVDKRRLLADHYLDRLGNHPQITLPNADAGHTWQSFMVTLPAEIDRKTIIEAMLAKGVQTNLGAQALHCLSYFRDRYGYKADQFPNAAMLYRSGLVLPLYGKLTISDLDLIISNLLSVLESA